MYLIQGCIWFSGRSKRENGDHTIELFLLVLNICKWVNDHKYWSRDTTIKELVKKRWQGTHSDIVVGDGDTPFDSEAPFTAIPVKSLHLSTINLSVYVLGKSRARGMPQIRQQEMAYVGDAGSFLGLVLHD